MSSAEEIELVNRMATAEAIEEEAHEGEGNACNDSDEQTNLAMSLLAHVVGRQAAKDKAAMEEAKVMKAMKRTNAKKAMKTMKAVPPKSLKLPRAMKTTTPKDVKSAKTTKVVKAKTTIRRK